MTEKLRAGQILTQDDCRAVALEIETFIRKEFQSFHLSYAKDVKRYYERKGKDADFLKYARHWVKKTGAGLIAAHLERRFCEGTTGEFSVLICGVPPGSQAVIRFNSTGGRSWWNAYSWVLDLEALSHDRVRYPYRDPGVTRYY